MNPWDTYCDRIHAVGPTKRKSSLKREVHYLNTKLPESLSFFHDVPINGHEQDVAIIDTDNLNEKLIYSMPEEDIAHGGIVEWMDNHWLVTERDAGNEVYTRAKMVQCNFLIKWIDSDADIQEQWCIVEDGTKYLTGEYEDKDFIVTRGDSRLAVTFSKNEHTAKLRRGMRFIIDDPDAGTDFLLAYELTKPYKLSNVFNGAGIYKFVFQEVNTTDEDNLELRVADYYKYYPKDGISATTPSTTIDPDKKTEDGRQVWL